MGGWAPLGYDVKDRKLIVNEAEASVVRRIFERFLACRSPTTIVAELAAENFVNKYGKRIDRGMLYKLLHNRVYVGDAVHKGKAYPGEHEGIIPRSLGDRVQAALAESPSTRPTRATARTSALLKGLIFGPIGRAMCPTHTRKKGKLYRYYISQSVLKEGPDACPVRRVPAGEVEKAVVDQLRVMLRSPEIVVATWRSVRKEIDGLTEAEVCTALENLDALWEELFPVEQARIVRQLVDRVDVTVDGIDIRLRTAGFASLAEELAAASSCEAA
jgi:hypothetical protein